jgi:purine-nucleoside phosphorylase
MTEQRKKIFETVTHIKKLLPVNYRVNLALITEGNYKLPANIKILKKIDLRNVPVTFDKGFCDNPLYLLLAKTGNLNFLILKGRLHYYDGIDMRDIAHFIYCLKHFGVEKILSIDEVGFLNPRFKSGDIALIYDHINLMGDNPLIGENDNELGIRFPDMSNAYDAGLFSKVAKVFLDNKMKLNESVYLGLIGPESETEAEVRFYREIGSDVLGYSLVPENITAVHTKIKYTAIGLITRELIADKMKEDTSTEKEKEKEIIKNYKKAEGTLNKILITLLKSL